MSYIYLLQTGSHTADILFICIQYISTRQHNEKLLYLFDNNNITQEQSEKNQQDKKTEQLVTILETLWNKSLLSI